MDNINNKEIQEKVNRLNYLYLQSKSPQGLNIKEQEEQGLLREFFLKLIKENIDN